MPFATVNGIPTFYEPEGEGPNLLFVCGPGGDHSHGVFMKCADAVNAAILEFLT